MATPKRNKPTYADLERQATELRGQLAHAYKHAAQAIAKASTGHMVASGVLLQLHALGGRAIIDPVLILDGLSPETIEALKKDLQRSFDLAVGV